MGTLLLVRHGQASAFAADYDKLSELGERQAALLGALWGKHAPAPTRLVSGPRARQKRTAELLGLGPFEVIDDLDEMRVEPLAKHHLPSLIEKHETLKRRAEQLQGADEEAARRKAFQQLAAEVLRLWARGEAGAEDVETWAAFQARVAGVLGRLTQDAPRGARIVAVSSAGVIAAAVQRALGFSDEHALELSLRVRNSSVTEFLFSGERFTLSAFNQVPHLEAEAGTITLL